MATAHHRGFPYGLGGYRVWVHLRGGCVHLGLLDGELPIILSDLPAGGPVSIYQLVANTAHALVPPG